MRRRSNVTKKERRNYFLGTTAVVTFALTAIFAIPGAANKAFADDNVNGTTEVQVGIAVDSIDTVSYDVPLYYVLAVTKNTDTGKTEVVLPPEKDYYIKNISKQRNVAVTGLSVSSVTGATWSLTDNIDDTNRSDKNMALTVGGVKLPSVAAGAAESQKAEIVTQTDNTFYKAGVYQPIVKDTSLNIPITAKVSQSYQVADGAVTAQFRLNYQISPMDEAGHLLNADYEGPAPAP